MKVNEYLTPQEVAKVLGISKQTLLRYEKKKLFPKARRHPINNWRVYTQDDLREMVKIMNGGRNK